MNGEEVNEDILQYAIENVNQPLIFLEKRLTLPHGGAFLTGPNPTIADLQVFYECTDEEFWGGTLTQYPNIMEWMNKML